MIFLKDGLRYWIENPNANLKTIIAKHLGSYDTRRIFVAAYVSMDAGSTEEDWILVCIYNTSCQYEAAIWIKNGRVIGNFPAKLLKKAEGKVLKNQVFFLEK